MRKYKALLVIVMFPFILNAQYTGGSGDGFAVWTSQGDIALPVELLSYLFTITDKGILLEWETASELENLGYIIQRKQLSDQGFSIVDHFQSNPQLCGLGTSGFGRHYAFMDITVLSGSDYIYQIFAVDYSGLESFVFQTSVINFLPEQIPMSLLLAKNYPNPFNPETNIVFETTADAYLKVSVFNILGQLVAILADRLYEKGKHELLFIPKDSKASTMFICTIEGAGVVKNFRMIYTK